MFPNISPVLFVDLPWLWVTIRGSQDGGFSIDIEESPRGKNYDPFTNQIAYVEFYSHQIRGQYWRIPNTPEKWKQEIIWAYDELIEWVEKIVRTHHEH